MQLSVPNRAGCFVVDVIAVKEIERNNRRVCDATSFQFTSFGERYVVEFLIPSLFCFFCLLPASQKFLNLTRRIAQPFPFR